MGRQRKRTSTAHPGTYGGQVGRTAIDLDAVVDRKADGTTVTLLDRAVETLRFGGFTADVAARVGVSIATVREWETKGTAALVALNDGSKRLADLTPTERQAARFVTETARAEAEGKMLLLGLAEQLSRGSTRTITTEKVDANGAVLERTTKEEQMLPDGAMLRWRLERRWPDDYGPGRQQIEVSGPGGGPAFIGIPDSVTKLYDELDRLAAADTPPAVTNGHHPTPAPG